MPAPDPPFFSPRILKVLEPSAGQYVVQVKVDSTLAARFPDKPYGTAIEEIGLVQKETAQYAGYTLVAIEPSDPGGKDHLWVFQKLSGPEWTTSTKSKENLTPPKFRGQSVVVKTEQEVAPATLPSNLTGSLVASVVTQIPNTGKAVLAETTETLVADVNPLLGEEYGDIVTRTVSEELVAEGTGADTGITVISSTVEPVGNGLAVKQTKTAKGGWPDPVDEETVAGAEHSPPARYLRDLTRFTTSRKLSSMPGSVTLGTDDVSKQYKRETPDRVEERVTTEALNLTLSAVDTDVQQKPFVTITSVMTPAEEKVIPEDRSGSAKLVYENGDKQIWENTEEIAIAREGAKGTAGIKKKY